MKYRTSALTRAILGGVALLTAVFGSGAGMFATDGAAHAQIGGPGPGDGPAPAPAPRQEEFGVRDEPELGKPDCPAPDVRETHCREAWLLTRSPNFVTIKKTAYAEGTTETPQGVQVSASFMAEQPQTNVAITFSAEAYVEDDYQGLNRRMFIRALVDGQVATPGDVAFATGDMRAVRSFVFTARVDAGIHTAEIQWQSDPNATAYLRDASLYVQTGQAATSPAGALTTRTAPSGPTVKTTSTAWTDVPHMATSAFVPAGGVLAATLAAESFALGDQPLFLRALVDGAVIQPADVLLARGSTVQSRTMTFGATGLAPGSHTVRFQWRVPKGGTGAMGDRSLVVAAYPNAAAGPTHPFVAAPSGPNVETSNTAFTTVPDMTTRIFVPAKGNGEVAVRFSAEVVTAAGITAQVQLAVDNVGVPDTLVILGDGGDEAEVKSFVLSAKGLSPGNHTISIEWLAPAVGTEVEMGDRTMAVQSEVGFVPDLAEAPRLGEGKVTEAANLVGGIEALIGSRNVLTILWDPHRCDSASPPDPCIDQGDLHPSAVEGALYGDAGDFSEHNVLDYFGSMSGGRFTIADVGVKGWYDALNPADWYWHHPWSDCESSESGFTSGFTASLAEAVSLASADVDYAEYDRNQDGRLETNELAIIVVKPQAHVDGSGVRTLVRQTCPDKAPVMLDGIELPPKVIEWYTSLDPQLEAHQFTAAAHELLHLLGGADDMYVDELDHATEARVTSLMASSRSTTAHLDPVYKLALGWVTPELVESTSNRSMSSSDPQSRRVLILPRYLNPHGEEYFVLEKRQEDEGQGLFDENIRDSGIAVWHAVPDLTQSPKAPIGVTQTTWDSLPDSQGRWGIRLLRPFVDLDGAGVAQFVDIDEAFWDSTTYDLQSGVCPNFFQEIFLYHNTLTWADCTASGYGVHFISAPQPTMSLDVTVG